MIEENTNLYNLLLDKNILAILDGDKDFGQIYPTDGSESIKIALPYQSGPMLSSLSIRFGLPAVYNWNDGAKSRWCYLSDLIKYCIKENTVSALLSFLFSKEQFIDVLKNHTVEIIENAYGQIIDNVINEINGLLYFGGNELLIINGKFIIKPMKQKIVISAPAIKQITREYIKDLVSRALKNIDDGNYDSAITQSRTLLEEVFCYVIEQKKEIPSDSGDIKQLFNQVKKLYNMHADQNTDKRINDLLSGLNKIIDSIGCMRNEESDAHGVGSRRINISDYHARLCVNASSTTADFILSVAEKNLRASYDL